MFEIFEIYIPFVVIIITVGLNAILIFKNTSWVTLLITNIILMTLLGLMGINSFDLLGDITAYIIDLLIDIIGAIFDGVIRLFDKINPFT